MSISWIFLYFLSFHDRHSIQNIEAVLVYDEICYITEKKFHEIPSIP